MSTWRIQSPTIERPALTISADGEFTPAEAMTFALKILEKAWPDVTITNRAEQQIIDRARS